MHLGFSNHDLPDYRFPSNAKERPNVSDLLRCIFDMIDILEDYAYPPQVSRCKDQSVEI